MPQELIWQKVVGQKRIKKTLAAAFETKSLGHAYLFCGAPGVGKLQTALELACALLCDNKEKVPCYSCDSCRQVLTLAHPDFHCVFPVVLESNHKSSGDSSKLSEEGWDHIARETRNKLENPYAVDESRIKHIPVEWIRELNRAILRGTIKGKKNVSIICDIDTMQPASANAMLKTLEEPPPNTIIFLLTQRYYSVLLTIRSRCQIVRFGSLSSHDIAQSLGNVYSRSCDDPQIIHTTACAAGSYGKALILFNESVNQFMDKALEMWKLCVQKQSVSHITSFLEHLMQSELDGGRNYTSTEKILISFLQIIRTTFFHTINGAEKYIYLHYPELTGTQNLDVRKIAGIVSNCEKAIASIRVRGNILLVLYTFLLSVSELMHGKE